MKPTLQEALAQVAKAKAQKKQSTGPAAVDWPAMQAACTDEKIRLLAEARSLPESIFAEMHSRGLLGWADGPAFPLQSEQGVIGAHVKTSQGWRWQKSEDASISPLILGDLSTAGYVVVCESQWDAAAMASDLGGLDAGAAFVCTRGAANGRVLSEIEFPKAAKIVLVPQNDEPKADGTVASEKWFAESAAAIKDRIIYRADIPAAFKDANEWISSGETHERGVSDMLLHARNSTIAAMRVRALTDFYSRPIDDKATLLGDRWLCREGSALFIGPSGIGKSSASVQQDICWGLGHEAFGITPPRALRILTIQAENDDGDMIEMVRGVMDGLGLDERHREFLRRQVFYATIKTKTGSDFFTELRLLLDCFRPDLVRIDPLQSFLGDDFKEARALIQFCQTGLNPLLEEYQCGAIINHHTPKTTNRDTSKWQATDWMYAGAGSAQLTNWARAVLVVDSTSVSGTFKFVAAKRGGRIGWDHELERYFSHSKERGKICWVDADPMDALAASEPKGKKRKDQEEAEDKKLEVLACLKGVAVTSKSWEGRAAKLVSRKTLYRYIKEFQARDLIEKTDGGYWKLTDSGKEMVSPTEEDA